MLYFLANEKQSLLLRQGKLTNLYPKRFPLVSFPSFSPLSYTGLLESTAFLSSVAQGFQMSLCTCVFREKKESYFYS